MFQEMAHGIALTVFTATLAYALVDVVKSVGKKFPKSELVYPLLRIMLSVYLAIIFHANLLEDFGIIVFANVYHSYVLTGLVASLGAEGVYHRFGNLTAKVKTDNDITLSYKKA